MELTVMLKRSMIMIIAPLILFNYCYCISGDESADLSPGSLSNQSLGESWQLENGWTIKDGELVGNGYGRAFYNEICTEGPLEFDFNLRDLQGELHANINENSPDRYIIAFVNNENGSLSTYLIKQTANQPEGEIIPGQSLHYDPSIGYRIEILSDENIIQVFLSETGANSEAMNLIDYCDPDPLSAGGISLEIQENSIAAINSIVITCPLSPSYDEATPSLGVGYFKRPT